MVFTETIRQRKRYLPLFPREAPDPTSAVKHVIGANFTFIKIEIFGQLLSAVKSVVEFRTEVIVSAISFNRKNAVLSQAIGVIKSIKQIMHQYFLQEPFRGLTVVSFWDVFST